MRVVIITGMSGAGKTNAVDWFEDHGYYCVDNMPPTLIKNFMELLHTSDSGIGKVALVVDVRSKNFFDGLKAAYEELRSEDDLDFRMIFMDASDATLIKRYSETRRNHPLATGQTGKMVINQERELLSDIKKNADVVIDTTGMKVAELYTEMDRLLIGDDEGQGKFSINVMSFGFKNGIPPEADIVMDMRFIPNPFYVEELRHQTGNDREVFEYVMGQEVTGRYIESVLDMIDLTVPHYKSEGKNHLNIAIGCTGGQHRSVAVANRLTELLRDAGYRVGLEHREL